MSRNFLLALVITAIVATGLLASSATAASASANSTSSTFGISTPNTITVKQSQPNLMVAITETNNSGYAAWCNVRIPEINSDQGGYWVASSPFLLTVGQTGLGTPVPNTKKSSLTFELWCSPLSDVAPVKVAVTTSKVVVAGQV